MTFWLAGAQLHLLGLSAAGILPKFCNLGGSAGREKVASMSKVIDFLVRGNPTALLLGFRAAGILPKS